MTRPAGQAAGRRHLYVVTPHGLRSLQAWVGSFWDDVLTAFDEHVRTHPEEES